MARQRMTTKARMAQKRCTRSRLLLQGSALAAAVAFSSLAAGQARAQVGPPIAPRADAGVAVQGAETIQSGTVTVSRTAAKDTIQVNSPSAIIRWDTFDQATLDTTTDYINFLPAGTEMEFVGLGAEYTVLNRIFGAPDSLGNQRGIAFLGNVTSRLSDAGPIGGTIWFYAPGGILVNETATFNVGALMLTTSDFAATVDNNGTTIDFLGAAQADSSVLIEAGSVINALNDGSSYLAVFAPRIEQDGDVNVDGSVGYIAGEAGTLRISPDNLFDIAITQGTDDANGIVHTGDTGGPAAGSAGDGHGIYFVAVPKNNALTMLLSGGIGYTGASTATVDDGRIILSAGNDVTSSVGTTGPTVSFIDNTANPLASISIQGGSVLRSDTQARAEGNISAVATVAAGAIQFSEGSDFLANAELQVQVGASGGDSILAVGGDLAITGGGPDTGGTAVLESINGGSIFVGGDINVSTGNATSGGTASILTTVGGIIQTNGTVNINAGGGSQGGTANLIAEGGASGIQALAINVNATATGEDGNSGNGNIGGDATGGTVNILIGTNQFGVDGAGILQTLNGISANASAIAGSGSAGNGTATGGTINFQIDSGAIGPVDPVNPGTINLRADGMATSSTGGTAAGGTGIGGTINIDLNGGTVDGGTLSATADGVGSQGGNGTGGTVTFNLAGATTTLDFLTLGAGGVGGAGQSGDVVAGTTGTAGGTGTAGSVALNATSGALTVTNAITLAASANTPESAASGGFGLGTTGGAGGAGFGGTSTFTLEGNATVSADSITVSANASGGEGGSTESTGTPGGAAGNGGTGTAGTATFNNRSGSLSFNAFTVEASGAGGAGGSNFGFSSGDSSAPGGNGGDGIGGTAIINLEQDDGSDPTYTVNALGDGGFGGLGQDSGSGGAGFGGDAQLNIIDAAVNLTTATINAGATGGDAGFVDGPDGIGGNGGAATGGSALLNVDGVNAQFSSDTPIFLFTDGLGGSGAFGGFDSSTFEVSGDGGAGGSGTGGTITIRALNGGILEYTLGSTTSAVGSGGNGADGLNGGAGGDGIGGTISVSNSAGGSLVATDLSFDASGFGGGAGNGGNSGAGGTGGNGTGGTVTIASEGEIAGLIFLEAYAMGTGGSTDFGSSGPSAAATTGGVGQGGTIDFTISGTGPVLGSLSSMILDASGTGGTGGPGSFGDLIDQGGTGGMGGAGIGGSVAFGITGAGASLAFDPTAILLSALGTGGTGGEGGGNFSGGTAGDGGTGGDGTGGAVILRAGSGSTLDLGASGSLFTFGSEGIGGAGGTGGDIDMVSGGIAGNGGDGGTGTGGSPVLRAIGGTITGADLQLTATGTGGAGGVGGDDGTVALGATGNGGTGVGGNPILEVLDGSPGPGILAFNDVSLFANGVGGAGALVGGTLGGRVEINDLSPDPLGLMTFNSLTVDATGDASTANGGLFMTAGSGTVFVTTNVAVDVAGNIQQDFAGDGRLSASGDIALNAVGNIIVTHTGNTTPVNSIDAGGAFTATAGGNFDAGAGTIVNSALASSITAQNIGFDQILSGAGVTLNAINGNILGGPVGLISAATDVDLDATQAIDTGDILTDGGTIFIDAGTSLTAGNVQVASGDPTGDKRIIMTAGGDIVAGAIESSDAIGLTAGGDIDFTSAASRDLTFNAGGAITGSDIFVAGVQSFGFDNAELTAGGAITLNSVEALDNVLLDGSSISVGSATGLDIIANGTGAVAIGSAFARRDVSLTGTAVTLDDGTVDRDLILNATGGDVSSSGTIAVSRTIDLDAAGNIGFVSLSTTEVFTADATGDIVFTNAAARNLLFSAGGTITGNTIAAAGVQSFGFDNAELTAGGAIAVDSVEALDNVLFDGASVTVGSATGLDIIANSTGAIDIGSADSRGMVSLTGSSVALDSGTVGTDLTLNATAGNIAGTGTTTVGGGIDLDATGDIVFGTLNAQGGDFTVDAGGNVLADHAEASGDFIANAGGDFTTGLNSIVTGGDIVIVAGDIVDLGNSTAGGLIDVTGSQIDFANLAAGGTIDLLTAITANTVRGNGIVTGGTITAGAGPSQMVTITADNGIAIESLTASTASLVAINGPVSVSADIDMTGPLTASGTSVLLRSMHDLAAQADASAGNVDIAATGMLELLGASATQDILLESGGDLVLLDDTVAGGLLSLTAGGLLDVQALAAGATVSGASNDINIGSAASLGQTDLTSLIALSTSGDMLVGGDGSSTGVWQLDNNEFTRVHSGGDIALSAGGSAELADLDIAVIDNLSGAQSGNVGRAGAFELFANNGIDVTGNVLMTNATADNAIDLSTELDLFLDAATGLLEITDGNGALTGTVLLGATNVYAMTRGAFDDIQGLSVADVDARLADSDGMDNPDGVIRAGTLDITTFGSDVFIQNTVPGTGFDERRGFTVDALILSDPASTQPIVINGVIGTATGVDAIGLAAIGSDFDPASTINGCLIANPLSCSGVIEPEGPGSFDNPIQDLIERDFNRDDPTGDTNGDATGDTNGAGASRDILDSFLIEVRDPTQYGEDPLIDDPVTGAGNEDLWTIEPDEGTASEQCGDDEPGCEVEPTE